MAQHVQDGDGIQARQQGGILARGDPGQHGAHGFHRIGELQGGSAQHGVRGQGLGRVSGQRQEVLHRPAFLHPELPAHEIQGLDPIRPFIDRGDLAVPEVLLGRVVHGVAVATEDLEGPLGHAEAPIRAPGLADGCEQLDKALPAVVFLPLRDMGHVHAPPGVGHEGPHGLHVGGLEQEGAPDIRMLDDQGLPCPLARTWTTALQTLPGVGQRGLMGRRGVAEPLDADLPARGVHHLEHVDEPLFLLTQEEALTAVVGAEHEAAGGRAVDAQLVLDARAGDIVGFAQGPTRIHAHLGHDEEADALRSGGSARRSGQHGMDDIRRQLMIAAGDEDLLPGNEVGAVALAHGLGRERAQVAARTRFGQAHGARPFPGVHPFAVGGLEILTAEGLDQVGGAARQQHLKAQGRVGAHDEFADPRSHGFGQAHATELGTHGGADPATRGEVPVGRSETLGKRDTPVLETGAGAVALLVAGRYAASGHLQGLVQHHGQLIPVELLVVLGTQHGIQIKPLQQVESDITIVVEVLHGASGMENVRRTSFAMPPTRGR